MVTILFVDEQHQKNYELMKRLFPSAISSTEYQAACYISAIPLVFYKFEKHIGEFGSPVDWIINWNCRYLSQFEDETDEEYQERINISVDYDLTNSMQQLGRLALNLWNGYEHFNLMDSLDSVDEVYYQIIKQAMDIRMGYKQDKIVFLNAN